MHVINEQSKDKLLQFSLFGADLQMYLSAQIWGYTLGKSHNVPPHSDPNLVLLLSSIPPYTLHRSKETSPKGGKVWCLSLTSVLNGLSEKPHSLSWQIRKTSPHVPSKVYRIHSCDFFFLNSLKTQREIKAVTAFSISTQQQTIQVCSFLFLKTQHETIHSFRSWTAAVSKDF